MVVRCIVVDMGGELGCDGRGNNFTALWTLTIRSVGRIYFRGDGWLDVFVVLDCDGSGNLDGGSTLTINSTASGAKSDALSSRG